MITVEEYIKLKEQPIEDLGLSDSALKELKAEIRKNKPNVQLKTIGDLICCHYQEGKKPIYTGEVEKAIAKALGIFNESHWDDFFDIILDAIDEESKPGWWKVKDIKTSGLYKLLVFEDCGLVPLYVYSAECFEQDSEKFVFISKCVEAYLNYMTKVYLDEGEDSKQEIRLTIQGYMREFKNLTNNKRKEFKLKKENATFLSQMSAKISEVRKYKRNTKTHKEEKEHNPFYNDGDLL